MPKSRNFIKQNQNGFSHIAIILLGLTVIGLVAYFVLINDDQKNVTLNEQSSRVTETDDSKAETKYTQYELSYSDKPLTKIDRSGLNTIVLNDILFYTNEDLALRSINLSSGETKELLTEDEITKLYNDVLIELAPLNAEAYEIADFDKNAFTNDINEQENILEYHISRLSEVDGHLIYTLSAHLDQGMMLKFDTTKLDSEPQVTYNRGNSSHNIEEYGDKNYFVAYSGGGCDHVQVFYDFDVVNFEIEDPIFKLDYVNEKRFIAYDDQRGFLYYTYEDPDNSRCYGTEIQSINSFDTEGNELVLENDMPGVTHDVTMFDNDPAVYLLSEGKVYKFNSTNTLSLLADLEEPEMEKSEYRFAYLNNNENLCVETNIESPENRTMIQIDKETGALKKGSEAKCENIHTYSSTEEYFESLNLPDSFSLTIIEQ